MGPSLSDAANLDGRAVSTRREQRIQLARLIAERMRAALGQPVIIENVAGAGESIGVGRVARASPDGHTLSIGHWSTHVVNGAAYPLQYHMLNDFDPISADCYQSADDRRQECLAGEEFEGIDRLAQSQ